MCIKRFHLLLILSDMLHTLTQIKPDPSGFADYSSVMFDFAITGKSIFFLAPDLARYEAERGFYFDSRAESPGPILDTAAELIDALTSLEQVTRTYTWKHAHGSSASTPLKMAG